jgi:hypothetical protein
VIILIILSLLSDSLLSLSLSLSLSLASDITRRRRFQREQEKTKKIFIEWEHKNDEKWPPQTRLLVQTHQADRLAFFVIWN